MMVGLSSLLLVVTIVGFVRGNEEVEDWLERAGLSHVSWLAQDLIEKSDITSPEDLLYKAWFDDDQYNEYRERLEQEDDASDGGDSLAQRWDVAVYGLNQFLSLPLEQPRLPWNKLFLNNQCSAIGLLQGLLAREPPSLQQSAAAKQITSNMTVYSDYDMLRSVVIGRADNFRLPPRWSEDLLEEDDAFYHTGVIDNPKIEKQIKDDDNLYELLGTPYPADMIQDMNNAMDNLTQQLEARGVNVMRADAKGMENQEDYTGLKGHSSRDLMIMIGDTLFLSPTPFTSRSYEVNEVYQHVIDHVESAGGKVVDLRSKAYWNMRDEYGSFLRLRGEERTDIPLTETVPLFDAANLFVLNERVVVYLVSITGNRAGAELLQVLLKAMSMSVLVVEGAYYGSHIDTTILPLSREKIIYNSGEITYQEMYELFSRHGYDKASSYIGVSKDDFVPVEKGYNGAASNSIAMNLLQLSPETVVVEASQTRLKAILESHGFEVMTVSMPWTRDFAGSIHCVTCPLYRVPLEDRNGAVSTSVENRTDKSAERIGGDQPC